MPKETFLNLNDDKKNRIINIALEEFQEKAYQDVNIKLLIGKMGIPVGSFYQYFESKKDLYFYILCLNMDIIIEEYKAANRKPSIMDKDIKNRNFALNDKFGDKIKYKSIIRDNFNKAPTEIKREWYFEYIMKKYINEYDTALLDSPEIALRIKDNKRAVVGLFLGLRSIAEQFFDYSENYQEYRKTWDLYYEIIISGILALK